MKGAFEQSAAASHTGMALIGRPTLVNQTSELYGLLLRRRQLMLKAAELDTTLHLVQRAVVLQPIVPFVRYFITAIRTAQ